MFQFAKFFGRLPEDELFGKLAINDEIDSLVPSREDVQGELEKRLVTQFLTLTNLFIHQMVNRKLLYIIVHSGLKLLNLVYDNITFTIYSFFNSLEVHLVQV